MLRHGFGSCKAKAGASTAALNLAKMALDGGRIVRLAWLLLILLIPGCRDEAPGDDPPDAAFTDLLRGAFGSCEPHVVTFPNPYTGGESSCTIYLACTDRA